MEARTHAVTGGQIIFSDDKLSRRGKGGSGGGQNDRLFVGRVPKKSDIDDPVLHCASETWGQSVMVTMCVSKRGILGRPDRRRLLQGQLA